MDRDGIATTFKQIVVDKLDLDINKIVDESRIVDDLGADSLETMEIIMAVEEQFEIELVDEDGEGVRTVKQAIDLICQKKS